MTRRMKGRRRGDAFVGPLRVQTDWPALRRTIVPWCENGFNLVRTAAALYIHRNTLVYRLGKIEEVTRRSLRDHPATLALYIACLADQLDNPD
jgi:carbohydrate diacid regulator